MPSNTITGIHGSEVIKQSEALKPEVKKTTESVSETVKASSAATVNEREPIQAISPEGESTNNQNVTEAVDRVQEVVSQISRDLQFSIDEDSGETVVRVVDSDSGELIRQIPSAEILEISRALEEVMEELPTNLLLSEKV